MRSKEWSPAVEQRRLAKKRRRAERRATAKLMGTLAIPGQPGCPGFVRVALVADRDLDQCGVWSRTTLTINMPRDTYGASGGTSRASSKGTMRNTNYTEDLAGEPGYCGGCHYDFDNCVCAAGPDEVDPDVEDDDVDRDVDEDGEIAFADPGGRSALRAASAGNPRNLPCPTCREPNRITPADRARGYQCDRCADRAEGYGD